jgi:hypothetical protein
VKQPGVGLGWGKREAAWAAQFHGMGASRGGRRMAARGAAVPIESGDGSVRPKEGDEGEPGQTGPPKVASWAGFGGKQKENQTGCSMMLGQNR